jgi:hypothetical protein
MSWEPKPDSEAAQLDEAEHLAKVARDLTANEPPRPKARELDALFETIGEFVSKALAPLKARIAELEQQQLKLGGTWKVGERYLENCLVSFQGGLWLSRCPTGGDAE